MSTAKKFEPAENEVHIPANDPDAKRDGRRRFTDDDRAKWRDLHAKHGWSPERIAKECGIPESKQTVRNVLFPKTGESKPKTVQALKAVPVAGSALDQIKALLAQAEALKAGLKEERESLLARVKEIDELLAV